MKKLILSVFALVAVAAISNVEAKDYKPKSQTKWTVNDDGGAQYYYMPEIDAYYYVPRKQYIYQVNGHWAFASFLPAAKSGVDLSSLTKIAVTEAGAYRFNAQHKAKYASKLNMQKERTEEKAGG